MTTFSLPDLGEGLQEAEIVAWHVETGERVVADQPLVSVETDKAVVEVPAPQSGTVTRLHAAPGDVVPVGAPLVDFDSEGKRADSGVIVGSLATEATRIEEMTGAAAMPAGTSRQDRIGGGVGGGMRADAQAGGAATRVRAAPAVREHARVLGLDIDSIAGSGPGGSVTVADLVAAGGGAVPAGAASPAAAPAPWAARGERLRGVRRAMARAMEKSHAEMVPANVMDEVDIDHWPAGENITIRLIAAIAAAARAEPSLNAWYDKASDARLVHEAVDLGIAVHTGDGLFVPVFRDVGNRTPDDIASGLARMKADVRARSIPPEELRGATITLSNFGVFGVGRFAEMVIVPPQVAIVGAGRVEARVVAPDGVPVVRRMLPLSLTFDHRSVNGGEAAGFFAAMRTHLSA